MDPIERSRAFWNGKLTPRQREIAAGASEVWLLALDPFATSWPWTTVRSYRVEVSCLLVGPEIEKAWGAVEEAVASFDGNLMSCFNPRHALVFERSDDWLSLLLCFECHHAYVEDESTKPQPFNIGNAGMGTFDELLSNLGSV